MSEKRERNNFIELVRFSLCLIILIHHSGLCTETPSFFVSGLVAADAFFVITGYFTFKHFYGLTSDEPMRDSLLYSVNKVKKALPFAITGTVIVYILDFCATDITLQDKILSLQNLPFELSQVSLTGVIQITPIVFKNVPLWYLSAILIVLPLIAYAILKHRDLLKYFVWFLPLFIYAWFLNELGWLGYGDYTGFLHDGLFRATAGLLIGGASFFISEKIKNLPFRMWLKIIFTVFEFGGYLLFAYCCHRLSSTFDQVFAIYLFAMVFTISVSEIGYTSCVCKGAFGSIAQTLGKISLPIYCLHWPVYRYIEAFVSVELPYWVIIGVTLIVTTLISFAIMGWVDVFKKKDFRFLFIKGEVTHG